MQYIDTSQDRPENSPLYSVNTGLDSFILFNNETLSEQVTLTELMVDREEEEHNTEVSKQFAAFENISKPNTSLELQIICPSLLNLDNEENIPQHIEKLEELKQAQLRADIQGTSESTLVGEDNHQIDETENSPL